MRSLSIQIPLKSLTNPIKDFLDDNKFDYEQDSSNSNVYTIWIHEQDHAVHSKDFQHFKNFNKQVYSYENKFLNLLNHFRNDDSIELFEEDLNGDYEIKGKKYKNIKRGKIKDKILDNLKRIDEI